MSQVTTHSPFPFLSFDASIRKLVPMLQSYTYSACKKFIFLASLAPLLVKKLFDCWSFDDVPEIMGRCAKELPAWEIEFPYDLELKIKRQGEEWKWAELVV